MSARRVSLTGLAAGLCLLLGALSCGKGTEKPSASAPAATPAAVAQTVDTADAAQRTRRAPGGRTPVIWLGLDGLDWELLDRLAAEGKMPNWKRLDRGGVHRAAEELHADPLAGRLDDASRPASGPTSHRVLDFQEVDPKTGQKVPISGDSRAVPAIWNVASAAGRTVGVVGWWATHPAEEVNGFFVTDHASPILFEGLPRAGVAYPASLAPGVEQIVARDGHVVRRGARARSSTCPPAEIAAARAAGAGLENPIVALARILGATRVQQRIARDLYDRNLPDLMIALPRGHRRHRPRLRVRTCRRRWTASRRRTSRGTAGRSTSTTRSSTSCSGSGCAGPRRTARRSSSTPTTASSGATDRPCERSSLNPATAAFWHRLDGVFAAWGARVRHGARARRRQRLRHRADGLGAARASGRPALERHGRSARPSTARRRRRARTSSRRRRCAASQAEAMSEKEASEYAKKLRNLGYLSGSEPAKLAPIGRRAPRPDRGRLEQPRRLPAREHEGPRRAPRRPSARRSSCGPATPRRSSTWPSSTGRAATGRAARSTGSSARSPPATPIRRARSCAGSASTTTTGKKAPGARGARARGARAYPGRRADRPRARPRPLPGEGLRRGPARPSSASRPRPRTPTPSTPSPSSRPAWGAATRPSRLFERSLRIKPDQPGVHAVAESATSRPGPIGPE